MKKMKEGKEAYKERPLIMDLSVKCWATDGCWSEFVSKTKRTPFHLKNKCNCYFFLIKLYRAYPSWMFQLVETVTYGLSFWRSQDRFVGVIKIIGLSGTSVLSVFWINQDVGKRTRIPDYKKNYIVRFYIYVNYNLTVLYTIFGKIWELIRVRLHVYFIK